MEIIIIVLSITTPILGYTTFNLLRKTEKLEDIIIDQTNYIDEFSKQLDIADERLAKIDEKGSFKSDDEIGWFFKQIKVIQESITRFKQTQNAEKTKKEE
jgi:HAMP domain-containing protein|tara:strand:- start:17713 stop:18012 length:300 start_codon:yes stop_codon:yes gene_type:complete